MGRREKGPRADDAAAPSEPARAPAHVEGSGLDCSLCCEPLRLTALGPCGHSGACHVCELRRRVIYKKRDCQFCRAPLDQLIIARPAAAGGAPLDFAALLDGRTQSEYDKEWAVTFAQRADRSATRAALAEPRCATCAAGPFGSVEGLRAHTRSAHGLEYCAVCLAGAPRFLSEHAPMAPAALRAHAAEHPACALCPGVRLFDAEALEKHMADAHWRCTLCEQAEARHCDSATSDRVTVAYAETQWTGRMACRAAAQSLHCDPCDACEVGPLCTLTSDSHSLLARGAPPRRSAAPAAVTLESCCTIAAPRSPACSSGPPRRRPATAAVTQESCCTIAAPCSPACSSVRPISVSSLGGKPASSRCRSREPATACAAKA